MRYLPGIENLSSVDSVIRGKKLGLLTNHTGIDSEFNSDVDILLRAGYKLEKLFAPEHGIRGELQANARVETYKDERTGLQVVSLFGSECDDALKGVECMMYDIQDIGVRHFSYPYLMAHMMRKSAEARIPFVVLDRYNPLGLNNISGNIFDDKYTCAFGGFALATTYGMTAGELARYINAEYRIGCELYVAPCIGLYRNDDHSTMKAHWIPPSPNCPTFDTAVCYAGGVIFEGTNISEGRGTTKPFELIGAPWLDNEALAASMREERLEGVSFRVAYFTPTFSKYTGELCRGVQLHVSDYKRFDSYRCALLLLDKIKKMHHDKLTFSPMRAACFIDHLAGTDALRRDDFDPYAYIEEQKPLLDEFKARCRKYYIYE